MCRAPDTAEVAAEALQARRKVEGADSAAAAPPRAAAAEQDLPASHKTPADAPETLLERVAGVTATLVLWPLILLVPLALQHSYTYIWREGWYAHDPSKTPSPLGLSLGLGAVAVGQVFVLAYQLVRHRGSSATGRLRPVQPNEYRVYDYRAAAAEHLAQPEGFALIGGYLVVTWMLSLMPASYYSFEGGVEWGKVALCLLLQDFLQYLMHRAEHRVSKAFYRASHEPHHQFTNPRLFDAFNGSFCDTLFMIVIPLFITKSVVHCNVWTYMAFGSSYANWLCLIHSETHHPWDPVFYKLGLGTAADHHVHHKLFAYNFGHLFLYWDVLFGTYRDPRKVRQFSASGKAPVPWKPHRPGKSD